MFDVIYPNVCIILKIWNRKVGSAWCDLIQGMKNMRLGVDSKLNVYANFQMTPSRSHVCYKLRKLKRENKIETFMVDENANMAFTLKGNKEKFKVC